MTQKINARTITLNLSAWLGFAAMILPLYLYPYSAIDPIDAYPFYTSPQYFIVFMPYAFIFFISSLLILRGKEKFIFLLLFAFAGSHFHFASAFPGAIVLKPLLTAVFLVFPLIVFLAATGLVLKRKT